MAAVAAGAGALTGTSPAGAAVPATIDPRSAAQGPPPRMSWIGARGLHTAAGRVIDLTSIPYQLVQGCVVQGSYVVGTRRVGQGDRTGHRAYRVTSGGRITREWGFVYNANIDWLGTVPHTGSGGSDRFVTLYTDGFETGTADVYAADDFARENAYYFDGYAITDAALAFHDDWIWRRHSPNAYGPVRLDRYNVRTGRVEVLRKHTIGLAAHPATGRAAYDTEGRSQGVFSLDGDSYTLARPYTEYDFSPSGRLLACAARDGLDIRRAATGKLVRRYAGAGIASMAWESDDALLFRAQGGVYRSLMRVSVGSGQVRRVTNLRRDDQVFPLRRY